MDLILLDVKMPVMDGLSFLRILRGDSATADTPVIMLSGAEDREDILQAAKLGIRGYVLKSNFSLKDLLTRVTKHFDGLTPVTAPLAPPQPTPPSAPNMTKGTDKPAAAAPSKSGPSRPSGEIPSLIGREQCIERAKQALHGRTFSGVVAQVISMAASPDSNASDLTAMIARDPLVSARVLQVANSPAYASKRGPVSTLPEAVRNIGCAAVRNGAAAIGVFNAMPVSDSDGFNQLRCWQHAFAAATLCNHLATQRDSGLAYLVGLCHDLGEILFHSQFAEEYRQVLEIEQSTGKPRHEVEKIVLGMSHGEVLQTIVQCLQLPNAISTPILEYHSKGPASHGGSPLTKLLRAADLYANGMLLASSHQSPVRPLTCADVKDATGHDNPPRLDRVAMRGEILALTATLSGFSQKQQAEAMASPFPRKPVRIWLARNPELSSLDPLEAALELLADVTPRDVLPGAGEAAEYQAIVVMAHNASAPGFTPAELKKSANRPNGEPLPVLWLVGKIDGDPCGAVPSAWPIPLAKLADFVAGAGIA